MKYVTYALFSLYIVFITLSCNKNNSSDSDPSNLQTGTITAKLDGQDFEWDATSILSDISGQVSGKFFSIQGTEGTEMFTFQIFTYNNYTLTEKSYSNEGCDILQPDFCVTLSYITDQETYLSNASSIGSVTIDFSSLDFRNGGSAVGTFSGTLEGVSGGELNITDGKFNVNIL